MCIMDIYHKQVIASIDIDFFAIYRSYFDV